MADNLKNSATISKKDESFPAYLDFDKLRSEGIDYLGKLAGQIWIDHNVHDPGITILEMLCYALLDLGYRTQLPLEDILAQQPDDKSPDNNFFSPAQILACNPLTVIDFRKLLIDLKEIRNAWLEPATDICRSITWNLDSETGRKDIKCESFLNGLYHVYLDLEKDIYSYGDVQSDFRDKDEACDYKEIVIRRVKETLMAHRNFCEDFADIRILCKLPMGICAEIELEDNAKADEVYMSVVEALRNFFTPVPRFYTLQQLLDKQKSIEEIFAGRPYNISQSHGFVDTEEFEALNLKKEIHTSDVYNVLFKVPGVRSVRNLSLRTCNGTFETSGWKFQIKENHIPEFTARCSGFRFTRNGMPLSVDVEKYQGLFDLNFSHSGKVLYEIPSPYLDAEIPKGSYRSELANYYSIQNEFPRVYAIEEGGLADKAPDKRKAQALQLKGYLLFFDQLLANYLTQLGNIRSLFALDSPESGKEQHTYFINQLTSVPELQKLLRYPSTENGGNGGSVSKGDTLVFPMDKNKLLALKESDQLKYFDLEQEPPFVFSSQAEKDIEISQLKDDLKNEVIDCEIITKTDHCVYYYILSSSENIALVSKNYFKNTDLAQEDADSVKYIGEFNENYRSFVDSNHRFSFTIDMNLASFAEYLQLLMEDRELYLERRQGFLQHLLARFAETFTDYALLTFGNNSGEQIEESIIEATERFLSQYDEISGNRGKAFDYITNGWNNDNISGFEKRVKALSGIEEWKRYSLCNFEVNRYDDQYVSHLKLADRKFFRVHELYETREEAGRATKELFTALSDREKYEVQRDPREKTFAIAIRDDDQRLATYWENYKTEDEAQIEIKHLYRLFSGNPAAPGNIFASDFIYFLQLRNYKGNVVHKSVQYYNTEAIAKSVLVQIKQGINDEDRWQAEDDSSEQTGTLFRIPNQRQTPRFIDLDAFTIDIDDMPAGESERFSYDLLDIKNRFNFRPFEKFDSLKQARKHWQMLLAWMTDADNYTIRSDKNNSTFSLHIVVDDEDNAVCQEQFISEEEAQYAQNKILSIIRRNVYSLTIQKVPNRWKFHFRLGIEQAGPFTFESLNKYESREEAFAAATGFQKSIFTLQVRRYKDEGEFRLVPIKPPEETSSVRLIEDFENEEEESLRETLNRELSLQQEVNRLLEEPDGETFLAGIDQDYLSKQGRYVYRLIDKDNIPACYSEIFLERSDAEKSLKTLRKVNCEAYPVLEICLGGSNIISEHRDEKTDTVWYHYLIRSRNRFNESGDELTLFESVQGYHTIEDAEMAFSEHYLQILDKASTPENYGTIISMEEKIVHQPMDYSNTEAIVFIPQATRDKWGEETNKRLIALAKSYPIRVVDKYSDKFHKIFPCEEKPKKLEERICKPAEETPVYYFQLYHTEFSGEEEGEGAWQSTGYYNTPEEARKRYRFFRMLLCYPGNFFVRCDPCSEGADRYRICLREVLAESTARFATPAEAWGKEGVQKFICVSQSERAFHPYTRERDGCFTFFLACAESVVYHPCRYDTPKERDAVIEKLYREIHKQHEVGAWEFSKNLKEETHFLLNQAGEPFATVSFGDQYEGCERWINFFSEIRRNQVQYTSDENGLFSASDDESGITVYANEDIEEEVWKKNLEAFACNYPIVKRFDEKTGKYKYCVEIKLPGFSSCGENNGVDEPCGCNGRESQPEPDCYIAWKSRCCFTSCEDAKYALRIYTRLLLNYSNYRPLFNCDCYDFGIALHYSNLEGPREIVGSDRGISMHNSEMVALNPQCYANPDEVCTAIERSWKLINAEGLHVTEHILLRPDCADGNDREEYQLNDCENKTGCEFEWSEFDDDPCADQPDVCFIPGADPYSFIATVVLPAWPARFRKPENRRLLENILYREAPAHVLLRIHWLAPHEFCYFEEKYKQWGQWLGQKKICLEDFNRDDFLEFLFERNYECLDDCDSCDCKPSRDEENETDFCEKTWSETSASDPNEFLNQVNDMYCWTVQECKKTEEHENGTDFTGTVRASVETDESPLRSKPQVVNSRMARYRSAVDHVLEETNLHVLAEKAKAFVTDPQPTPERTSGLLEEIVQNEVPSDGQALTNSQVVVLLQSVLCYYLDKVCFNGKDLEKIEDLQNGLEAIGEAEIAVDRSVLYEYWKPEVVRLYEPETDLTAIRKIITGVGDN